MFIFCLFLPRLREHYCVTSIPKLHKCTAVNPKFCHETLDGTGSNLTWYDYSHSTTDWFILVSVAFKHSNTWLVLDVAVAAHFRNPPPSPAPPVLICYREISCSLIYGVYFSFILCNFNLITIIQNWKSYHNLFTHVIPIRFGEKKKILKTFHAIHDNSVLSLWK